MAEEKWKGIFKVMEEKDELGQILAKLCVFPEGPHPDEEAGEQPIQDRLEQELGDLTAAMQYFIKENLAGAATGRIILRAEKKLALFNEWGLTGVPTNE